MARPISHKDTEPRTALKFSINQGHIDCAVRKDPLRCVIAQATKDLKMGEKTPLEVCVYPTVTVVSWSGFMRERYRTPRRLRKALADFDNGKGFTLPPGDYELPPVSTSQTMKAQAKRARKRRLDKDIHMDTKYPKKTRKVMSINPRHTNLKTLQSS